MTVMYGTFLYKAAVFMDTTLGELKAIVNRGYLNTRLKAANRATFNRYSAISDING